MRSGNGIGAVFLLAVLLNLPEPSEAQTPPPAGAQTEAPTKPQGIPPPDAPLPIKPPPVPTGVIPLPQGPVPTTQQAPVPAPAQPLPGSDRPLRISPDLKSVNGYVQDRALTLQDTVAIALYTSRDFASAVASLQQTQGRAGQARTALNPTLSANADATEYDAATTANLGALIGNAQTGTPQSLVITPRFNPVLTATFSLPLDVAGSLRAAASQAQFTEVAARIEVNRVRNEVVYNVKSAFYSVLRARAQVTVDTDSLNNTLGQLNAANKNYAAGTAPRFDVISAQRDVANAQQNLINSSAQLSINIASLKNTIGLDMHTRLRVSDQNAVEYPPGVQPPIVPPPDAKGKPAGAPGNPLAPPVTVPYIDTPQPVPAPPLEGVPNVPGSPGGPIQRKSSPMPGVVEDTFDFGSEFDTLLQEALRTRPEILEHQAQIAAAQRGIQYARRSQLPSLNLSLSDTYTPNAAGFTRLNVGEATLGLTVPIFDGGLARERAREARGVEASAQVTLRQSVDQVEVDVQRAYIALVQARSRVAVTIVGLAEAREAFRLAGVRYNAGVSQKTGVSPQIELSNAQNTLAQAQSNQIDALYDFNSARAQVDRAVGRFSFTGTAPGYPAPPPPAIYGLKH